MSIQRRQKERAIEAVFGRPSLDAALDDVSASARNRWLLVLCAEIGPHARGFALAKMQDIAQRLDGVWCLYLRHGEEVQAHPMTERLWTELTRWRMHVGMPPMPRYGEDCPLLQRALHDPRPLTPEEADEILGRLVQEKTLGVAIED